MNKIEYDNRGCIKYNPEFHAKQFEPWTWEEDLYLMEYYKIDGLRMMRFALEKKESIVYWRIQTLRKWAMSFNE